MRAVLQKRESDLSDYSLISTRFSSLPKGAKVGCYVRLDSTSEPIFLTPTGPDSLEVKQMIEDLESAFAQKEATIEERLQLAIAKENAVKEFIAAQREFGEELLNARDISTMNICSAEASQELSTFPRTTGHCANKRVIPTRQFAKPFRSATKSTVKHGEPEMAPNAPSEHFITPKQAAEFLKIAVSTLRDYSQRGIIPSHRLCKHRRYKLSELGAVMERNRIETFDNQASALKDLLR